MVLTWLVSFVVPASCCESALREVDYTTSATMMLQMLDAYSLLQWLYVDKILMNSFIW